MDYHFGICEWSMPVSGTLAIRLASQAGYEGIQLGEAGGRANGYPLNNRHVQAAYLEEACRCGIKLHSLNLGALLAEGTLNYAAETEQGRWARESLSKGFEVCRNLDLHAVVITVEPKTEEAFAHVVSHLEYAQRLSRDSGVEIAIESAQPLAQIRRLLDRLDEGTKLCMDLLNPFRFGTGDPREQIRAFGVDRISHFHMKDSDRELFQPGQRGCVPLGQGDAGFFESVKLIRSLTPGGWMISENYYYLPPMNPGDRDFLALAKQDLETLKGAFSQDGSTVD